jgi:EAL domain-containing protein (putative c-di-GMP-specific phosphodiesterase class I)
LLPACEGDVAVRRSVRTRSHDGGNDRAIAAAIIAMSRSLRINVTAEGVENLPQLLFLQQLECHEAQGFLLGKALAASDAHELLRTVAELVDGSRSQRLKAILG